MSETTKRQSLFTSQGQKLSWDFDLPATDRRLKQESPQPAPPGRLGSDLKRSAGKLENNTVKKLRVDAPFGNHLSQPSMGIGGQPASTQQRAPTPAVKAKQVNAFFDESSSDEEDENHEDNNYTSYAPRSFPPPPPAFPHLAAPEIDRETGPSREEQRLESERLRAAAQKRRQEKASATTPASTPAPPSARPNARIPASETIDLTSDNESDSRPKPPPSSKALPPSATASRTSQQIKKSSTPQAVQEPPRKRLGGSLFSDDQSLSANKSAVAAQIPQQTHGAQKKPLANDRSSAARDSALTSQPQQRIQDNQDKARRNEQLPAKRKDSLEPTRPAATTDSQRTSQTVGSAPTIAQHGSQLDRQQGPQLQQNGNTITKRPPPRMQFEIPTDAAESSAINSTDPKTNENAARAEKRQILDALNGKVEDAEKEREKAEDLQAQRAARKAEHERRKRLAEQAEKLQAQEEAKRQAVQEQQERARVEREAQERRRQEADIAAQLKVQQQQKAEQAEKRKAAAALSPKPPPFIDPKVAEEERRRQERIRKQEERIAKRKEEDAEDERLAAESPPSPLKAAQIFGLNTPSNSFTSSPGSASNGVNQNGPRSLNSLGGQALLPSRNKDTTQINTDGENRDRSKLSKDAEITQADAQLLHWRAHTDMIWPDILDLYESATKKKTSLTSIRRRYEQVKNAVEAASISSDLMDRLRRGDVVAKRQVNLRFHGQDIVVEPDISREEPLTIKLGPRPTTQPTKIQDDVAPQIVAPTEPTPVPSAHAERPDTGGKSLDMNFFLHNVEALHKSLEEDKLEESCEGLYYTNGKDDDDEDEGHFVYRVFRQRLSAEDVDAIEEDPDYQQELGGVEECEDCYSLEEANAAAELEAVKIRKTDPRWMTGRRLIDTDYDEYGMAYYRARHEELGGLDVWVDRILVKSDDPVAVVATVPKKIYSIKQRITTYPAPHDEYDLFSEPPAPSIIETYADNRRHRTDLAKANGRAIELFVDLTFKSNSMNMRTRDLEKQEMIAKLSDSLVGDDWFYRKEELVDGRKVLEVMVEDGRLEGPRNL